VLALVALLTAAGPLFLCMPLWTDSIFFDICARALLRGELIYREIFLHGPPGIILLQAGIRSAVGWRSESLRAVDLTIITAVIYLLVGPAQPKDLPGAFRIWATFALYLFYFATPERCHCQTDGWMLLPATAGLCLRQRQAEAVLNGGYKLGPFIYRALAEGVCWGLALLLKPQAAIPGIACWLTYSAILWKSSGGRRFLDAMAVLVGIGLPLALASAWLWLSGNWPYFLPALAWNSEYYLRSAPLAVRTREMLTHFWPFSLVHVVAIPLAAMAIVRCLGRGETTLVRPALLSGYYLGWLFQATLIQQHFDYHAAPAVLLAIATMASQHFWRSLNETFLARVVLWPLCLVVLLLAHPLSDTRRLGLWLRCWKEGSSLELRDFLTLKIDQRDNPSWRELERVKRFLTDQGVGDRELTCYTLSALPLYFDMDIKPSTRFTLLQSTAYFFMSHWNEMLGELASSPQRFVVCDRRYSEPMDKFPWTEPVVFESGRYQVRSCTVSPFHRVRLTWEDTLATARFDCNDNFKPGRGRR
jgi:hypothetical protein